MIAKVFLTLRSTSGVASLSLARLTSVMGLGVIVMLIDCCVYWKTMQFGQVCWMRFEVVYFDVKEMKK
jgi:hypothetical protein